jgi:hypothetical protein
VQSEEELLHVTNELVRHDIAHEINDSSDFTAAAISDGSALLFRLIDHESAAYLRKRCTLASFLSARHVPAIAGQSTCCDLSAKYFTGSKRTWSDVYAVLSVHGSDRAQEDSHGQIQFAHVVLFANRFGPPVVNMTVAGGQDKVLKIVSLRPKAPVLGFQCFSGSPGRMRELEVFLEFSSEEIQNEWLLALCRIGVVPRLESPSQDSGFKFCQTFAAGSLQLLRCVTLNCPI